MSLGRLEAYLYGSGTAGLRAGTSDLTIVETAGATETVALSASLRLSDALTDWQSALNASALANTYALTWNATTQTVTIARTAGALTFLPIFDGDLAAVFGYSANPTVPAASFSGDTPSRARFDDVRMSIPALTPGERANLKRYRHGRSEALCFGKHDICELKIMLPKARATVFETSYCNAGRIRVWQDQTLADPYSAAVPSGYLDGYVIACPSVRTSGSAEEWVEFAVRLGVPR